MDFLDEKFASVNRAQYAGFLGIDFNKFNPFKPSQTDVYQKDLMNRFPFSDFCDKQSEIVAALKMEADSLWQQYSLPASAETKNAISAKASVLNAYIEKANDYLNKVSCPPGPAADQVLNSSSVPENDPPIVIPVVIVNEPEKQLIKGVDNKILKYAAGAVIVLAVVKLIR